VHSTSVLTTRCRHASSPLGLSHSKRCATRLARIRRRFRRYLPPHRRPSLRPPHRRIPHSPQLPPQREIAKILQGGQTVTATVATLMPACGVPMADSNQGPNGRGRAADLVRVQHSARRAARIVIRCTIILEKTALRAEVATLLPNPL